jgi:hypothetical protein
VKKREKRVDDHPLFDSRMSAYAAATEKQRTADHKRKGLPDDNPITLRDEARAEFFHTIKRIKPDVLASLANDVLPSHKAFCDAANFYPICGFQTYVNDGNKPESVRLNMALHSWASRWHLVWWRQSTRSEGFVNEWCLDYAVETLSEWAEKGLPDELDWAFSLDNQKRYRAYRADYVFEKIEFHFDFHAWALEAEPWRLYEKKLDEAYKRAKETYRELQLFPAEMGDFTIQPAIIKRNPAHFDWLVSYQIIDSFFAAAWYPTLRDIAQEYGGSQGISPDSISDAVHGLAHLLGFTLRPSRIGKPHRQ